MITPLNGFHGALLGLLAQKRAAEEAARPRVKPRRQAAKGVVGERVIYWPPRNSEDWRALDWLVKKRGRITEVGSGKALVAFDSGDHAAVPVMHLDAEPLLAEELDEALASIREAMNNRREP